MYESMRNAVKKAQSEKKLQKLLSITIIAHITTILDLLSCEELKYMNSQEQERTYQHIKENFRHRLYYKAPVLQQYWKANMQHEDFKFQYSHVILDAKKTYENFLKKNINFPSPIWAVNVANTSFLKLTYWIDFGTPSQEIFNNSKKSESLETIKNIREKNTKIIWAFFSTISDWENFFMLTWQDIITYINEKKNTFWLSLILEENSPEIIVK
jgi:hypothetical protein